MQVIGLTGGSGSGKSYVSRYLAGVYGMKIIDADKIGHDIIQRGTAVYDEILQAFGKEIVNDQGEIDRKKLGSIVFANQEKLDLLNQMTHPVIYRCILEQLHAFESKGVAYCVIDAALLIQAGMDKIVDSIWVVTAPLKVRIQRLLLRDDTTEEKIMKRIEKQQSFEELKQIADVIIYNEVGYPSIEEQCKNALFKRQNENQTI